MKQEITLVDNEVRLVAMFIQSVLEGKTSLPYGFDAPVTSVAQKLKAVMDNDRSPKQKCGDCGYEFTEKGYPGEHKGDCPGKPKGNRLRKQT